MLLTVVDYGVGNLRSIAKSIEKANSEDNLKYKIKVSSNLNVIKNSDKLVLPGQGSFKACKEGIIKINGLLEELNESVLIKQKPIFGICAGMQLFASWGYEEEKTEGFNWIEGEVIKINLKDVSLKIPHIGWNEINKKKPTLFLNNVKDSSHAYFIHSFEFIPKDKSTICATTDYGKEINAAISKENILGTQFHPEKSQKTGIKILTNFLKL
jgi:glutamine amidotransferase